LDRQTLRAFNADAIVALEEVARKHGVSIRPGAHSFNESNARLKFELCDIAESGEVATPEAEEFKLHAERYGLRADQLFGTFDYAGQVYRVTGLKTRRPKYPICATNVRTGRNHKFPESIIRSVTIS